MHYVKELEVNNSGVMVSVWRILGYEFDAAANRGTVYVGGFAHVGKAPLIRMPLVFQAPEVDVTKFGLLDLYKALGTLKAPQTPEQQDPPLAGGTVMPDEVPAEEAA